MSRPLFLAYLILCFAFGFTTVGAFAARVGGL